MVKKDRMSTMKSKGSISSSSSYNQHASNSKVGSKTFRKVVKEDNENEAKLIETVKLLKNENKKLLSLLKESERTLTDKLKDARKEMEKMTTIINQLWPFIQTHLKRELGASKIANLKKMAKQESRLSFLDTLSNIIAKVKKDAEREGRPLFGSDIDTKFDKIQELKARLEQRDSKEEDYKTLIMNMQDKIKELDAFRLTATDYVMTKATSQEEVLFLVRANERISAYQENDLPEDDEKFEDGGFITKNRHYEILNDYEPAPSFLKTLTNEILYLDSCEDEIDTLENQSIALMSRKCDDNIASMVSNIDRLSIPECGHSNNESYGKIQKVNSSDQVPQLIKDTLADVKAKTHRDVSEDVGDDDGPSFGKNTLLNLKQQINHGKSAQNLNVSSQYQQLDSSMGLSSTQQDKMGSSMDIDRRLQHSIHSRQVQPTNTSQKLLSSRINAYEG
jgi:hypothetical protein